ncbi:M48 family metallopeptidase [Pseudoteredinibacter isoporae]|uniref:Zn-dependent protease with chaperone function n=1 Tax=Pseudoteredinibacter isoporae TaxID=570281 RepID=A0A7X0JSJ9_9GAMM|nr:M48 family metallopeptidase [Pseudoteredinibacter isoporae]MBB6520630.1 Zn-dependent protease with chaperone function [Pseudoteredinibacter isoporae]NHO86197.1 M48 family metallopeptidase [Pseudoteredinibacter isoporae]NIB25352.1 M48 family metallopeptidase [Pseudoteredinibacter isoporae]
MGIFGRYYRAGSSEQIHAEILHQESQLTLHSQNGEILQNLALGDCTLSAPIGRMPYRIEFPNGDCVECEDHASIEAIFQPKHHLRLVHYWERSRHFALLALLMLPLVTLLYIKVGLPILAKELSPRIPKEVLLTLDEQALKQMENYFKESKLDENQRSLLDRAWQRLPENQRYTLLSKNSPAMGANAFALPGGHILVTDDLVTALNNENEILAVLAHEAGHVEQHHGLRNVIQSLGTVALLTVIVGDISALAETVLVSGPVLFQQLSYSRDLEREADQFSINQLQQLQVPSSCLGAGLNHLMASHGFADVTDVVVEDAKLTPTEKTKDISNQEGEATPKEVSPEAASPEALSETSPEETTGENKDDNKEPGWKERLKKQLGLDEEIDFSEVFNYMQTHPATEERIEAAGGTDCPAPAVK